MRNKIQSTRRQFLRWTGALALAASSRQVMGANDDIRIAVIGLGGKGGDHLRGFAGMKGVRIVATCDVDPKTLAEKTKGILKGSAESIFMATDPRKVLERKDIDAVVIATPDHWHALLAVWACQAERDVYVEKPVSHNVWEGRQIVEAASKYQRIVQAGTQYRSCVGLREAADYIHSGALGKVLYGHVLWYEQRGSIGRRSPWTPDHLDYDLYCGPAPVKPLRRNQLHYDWHWIWSTGTGDLGNSGIHAFDICRWFAGYDGLPKSARCVGGRFGVDDVGETPNTQLTFLEYDSAPILIENRNLPMRKGANGMDHVKGVREGILLYCEQGYFAGFRAGGWIYDNDGNKVKQFKGDGGQAHRQNFVDAMRSRRAEDLNGPILQGHISSACCHLGNVSYQLGVAPPEPVNENLARDTRTQEILASTQKHLRANEIDWEQTPLVWGPRLILDPQKDAVVSVEGPGSLEQAQALVRGNYRAPFIVPEQV